MNSALVRPRTTLPPLRDATLLVTVLCHPAIGLAHFDEFASLEADHPALAVVHRAVLDIFADQLGEDTEAPTPVALKDMVCARGLEREYEMLLQHVRNNRLWQVLEEAAFEDALEGWRQAYALHERAGELNAELRAAEQAFDALGDEGSWDRLVSLKGELAREDGMEALIEGFGGASGRPSRSF